MNAREKVAALRQLMKKNGLHAYYVPSADPHQSEYLPEPWKYRAWVSGFTGSMGELVVGARRAGLWTDGRYWLQGSQELAGSGIDLMKVGLPETPDMAAWVARTLKKGQVLGLDPSVVSVSAANGEIGTLQPLAEIGAACRERGVPLHVDAAQRPDVTVLEPFGIGAWRVVELLDDLLRQRRTPWDALRRLLRR